MKRANDSAFTLVELLVVIAIIGILASAAVVNLSGQKARAREATRIADVTMIGSTLQQYSTMNNSLPAGDGTTPANDTNLAVLIDAGLVSKLPTEPLPTQGSGTGFCKDYVYEGGLTPLAARTFGNKENPEVAGTNFGLRDFILGFHSEVATTPGLHSMNKDTYAIAAITPVSCDYLEAIIIGPKTQ